MTDLDFSWKGNRPADGSGHPAFLGSVLIARQLAYDLSSSVPDAANMVTRHENLASEWDRTRMGVAVGLTYLVSQLDLSLSSAVRELWAQRRDLLHSWAEEQIRLGGGATDEADEDSDGAEDDRPRTRGSRGGVFPIPFKDVWRPTTRDMRVEDYVRDTVFTVWDRKSPKRKIRSLIAILKDPPAPETLETLFVGLAARNTFIHPSPHDSPARQPHEPRTRHREVHEVFTHETLEATAVAMTNLAEWLSTKLHAVTRSWVATNIKTYRRYLSEEQSVAFGAFRKRSGDTYKTFAELLNALTTASVDGYPSPKLILLGPDDEIIDSLTQLDELLSQMRDVPLVLFEGHGRPGRDREAVLRRWLAARRRVSEAAREGTGKRKGPKSWPWGDHPGEWKGIEPVDERTFCVRSTGCVFKEDADGKLLLDAEGEPKVVWHLDHSSYDDVERLRFLIGRLLSAG